MANKRRRRMSTVCSLSDFQRTRDFKSATSLLGVAVSFVLCQSVKIIPDIYELRNCDYLKVSFNQITYKLKQNKNGGNIKYLITFHTFIQFQSLRCNSTFTIEALVAVSNLLLAINASATIFIYYRKRKKVKDILIIWITKCCGCYRRDVGIEMVIVAQDV